MLDLVKYAPLLYVLFWALLFLLAVAGM